MDNNPAAISGPTEIPLKKATPIKVPTIKPLTIIGLLSIRPMPRIPNQETKTPTITAKRDCQLASDLNSITALSEPFAKGTKIAAVKIIRPTVMP